MDAGDQYMSVDEGGVVVSERCTRDERVWCGASLCVGVSGVSRQGDGDTIPLPSPPPMCMCEHTGR